MATRKDILLDEDRNFATAAGDFVTGESDEQNVELLLVSSKGSFRQFPTICVGIGRFLKKQTTDLKSMKREIMVNLPIDGYKVDKLEFDAAGEFNLDYKPIY